MKKILSFILFIFSYFLQAQTVKNLEIYYSDNLVVQLVFPKTVSDYKVSNENIEVENTDKNITIQGLSREDLEGKKNNLIIQTDDGLYYSIILIYKEDLDNVFYMINQNQAVNSTNVIPVTGNETKIESKVESKNSTKNPKQNNQEISQNFSLQQIATNMAINEKGYIHSRNIVENKGISIALKGIYSYDSKIYILFHLGNTTNIEYEIENYAFLTNSKIKKGKKVQAEESAFNPIYLTDDMKKILPQTQKKLVVVFDKFTINDDKDFVFLLNEKNGERSLDYSIKADMISKAKVAKIN